MILVDIATVRYLSRDALFNDRKPEPEVRNGKRSLCCVDGGVM